MKIVRIILSLAVAQVFATQAFPAPYPTRQITLVVPFGPGQSADIAARVIAEGLTAGLGQTVIVENRTGAGGMIAAGYVAKARPDGYTLLMGSSATHGINSGLYLSLPYDPVKDFVPVAFTGSASLMLSVTPSFPATNLAEVIGKLKEKPEEYGVAIPTSGAMAVYGGFTHRVGVKPLVVQYKSSSSAFSDVVGGTVPMIFDSISASIPYISAKKIKPIAVTSRVRSELLPDVPTMSEAGLPDFDVTSSNVIYAPKGTPEEVVSLLNAEIAKVVAKPDVVEVLRKASYSTAKDQMSPAQLVEFVPVEVKRWSEMIRSAGIKPQ